MTLAAGRKPRQDDDDALGVDPYPNVVPAGDDPLIARVGLYFDAGYERQVSRREVELIPPRVRIVGPLGGQARTSDPERLRWEARRLAAAADILQAELDAWHADHPPTTLDLDPGGPT